jgi:hypothetical protein
MTRNQIAIKLKEIANAHRQVRTAKVVKADYFLNNEIKDVVYPAVWFTMGNVDISGKEKVVTVLVTVADIIHHPENQTRVLDVHSDTERIADDLLSQIDWDLHEWHLERSTSYEYFEDSYADELAGVTFSIELKFPFTYDSCTLPSTYDLPDGEFIIINRNRMSKIVDFIVGTGQPMVQGATTYQNNLLTVPPLVFIDGLILTYNVRTDRRYIIHNSTTKQITITGGVNEEENVQIYI